MNELEQKLSELDQEIAETKQQFRERMNHLRRARRMAAKTLEQLKAL